MTGSNDQDDKQEEVYRLSSDLQATAISVQTGDDLADLLEVVVRLSGLVNGRVDEMRNAFEASDWNRRAQDRVEMRPSSGKSWAILDSGTLSACASRPTVSKPRVCQFWPGV